MEIVKRLYVGHKKTTARAVAPFSFFFMVTTLHCQLKKKNGH